MTEQKQLMCTFTNASEFLETIRHIKDTYTLIDGKIFVFLNQNNLTELYLTFNIEKNSENNRCKGTISIHRKKQTNTLFTLNGMNKLISDENGGRFEKNFKLDWELYSNSLILTNEIGTKVISIKLVDILSI